MKRKGYGMFGKTIAYILLMLSLISVPVGIMGTYYMANEGLYIVTDTYKMKEMYLEEYFYDLGRQLQHEAVERGEAIANELIDGYCIYYRVTTPQGTIIGNYRDDIAIEWSKDYVYTEAQAGWYALEDIENYSIQMIVPVQKIYPDYVAVVCFATKYAEILKITLPIMAVAGLIIGIAALVYLLCAAGWNRRKGEQTSGIFGAIPIEIFLTACVVLIFYMRAYIYFRYDFYAIMSSSLLLLGIANVILAALMSISARMRANTLWQYSIVGFLGKWVFKIIKKMIFEYRRLPAFWVILGIMAVLTVGEIVILNGASMNIPYVYRSTWLMALVLLVEKVIEAGLLLWITLRIKELYTAGQKIAAGKTDYKVDTSKLFGGLKTHGENLNSISAGVMKAVNERIKSEHFKTELITNVSHDIKTPLTSIINYSDLISKEDTDNEKIKEYSEVLYRQSGRLKKLIEDLVDASKASTGNIEVNLESCDVGVLLTQAVGEFEQRLYEKDIDLITKQPQTPVQIQADPKLLWRVFDNLMTNICKYSQNGTRVYLSVEEKEEKAVISFKNISAYPLDIDAEELMERFVRGDRSRHTEGNGLGLNIAKSLTELQNGTLELAVDGDLFKVLLSFPKNI